MKFVRSILISIIVLFCSVAFSHAAGGFTNNIVVTPPSSSILLPDINTSSPGKAIASVIAWCIGLTAVLTVLAATWSGIQMILAIWEEEKFKKARYTMIYAFIGLIVSGLAYAVVALLTNLNLDPFL